MIGAVRGLKTFEANTAASNGREQPTPVLIVCGEFGTAERYVLSAGLCLMFVDCWVLAFCSWTAVSNFLQDRGFSGVILEWSDIEHDDLATAVNNIYQQGIMRHGMIPPILVAHSLSTFLTQKFLESYAISGLVAINPLPLSLQTGRFPSRFGSYLWKLVFY
jgi:hypothetical protein